MKSRCYKCNEVIEKFYTGKKYKNGAKKYCDGGGRPWRGNTCNECCRKRHREYQRKKRRAHLVDKECQMCRRTFEPRHKNHVYCDKVCYIGSAISRDLGRKWRK